jgi:hypothetical protein
VVSGALRRDWAWRSRKLNRLITRRRDPPEDPYSYVTAPKKPKPPYLSEAAVADPPEE